MRINFEKIEIHNFMSFADEVIEFSESYGLNLICGKNNDIPGVKNGCGKTVWSDSIVFALFGQTRNNIKNSNIHNRYIPGKEVRVVAYFNIEDHKYKVASGFNKYGSPYCQLSEIIENDEVDLTKSTIAETRKYLETELLHCDISIFLRTIILSSDQNYNFYTLKKAEKKEFIEKLFDISAFGNIYNAIHRDLLDYDKSLLSYQNKLLVLNKSYEDYKQRIQKYNSDNKIKIQELNAKLDDLKDKHSKLKNITTQVNTIEVKKYEEAIETIDNAIHDANVKLRKLNADNSKLEIALHKSQTMKEQKQKAVDKHSELMNKLCNDCKKIFSDYYNIDIYLKEISKLVESEKLLINKLSVIKSQIKQLIDKISEFEKKQDKANNKIKLLTEESNKNNRNLQTLESNMMLTESEIKKAKNEKNPYSELLDSCKSEIDKQTAELNKIEEDYRYLKFAENIVSQDTLRKFIISDLIGLLNNKIKTYLTKFGARYNVTFDSDMNYTFQTDSGTCEYDNFSSGERARIMIATCFAFRDFMYIRNSFSSNILVLDEFIDGAIDSLAIESILDILKDFSNIWKQNIFVISHRKEVSNDIFDNIIQIVKTNNISKITFVHD